MAFDWREYLIVAHGWRGDGREVVQRTCLGRTYYYIYHLGLKKARSKAFTETMPGLHKKLWEWYSRQGDPDLRKIGVAGQRMHGLRIDADYRDRPITNLAGEVRKQLERAQACEALIAKMDGKPAPAALPP
jgi:hypothetical protein